MLLLNTKISNVSKQYQMFLETSTICRKYIQSLVVTWKTLERGEEEEEEGELKRRRKGAQPRKRALAGWSRGAATEG